MTAKLRVVVADDERPARSFLTAMLRTFEDVTLVAEAATGPEAVEAIERERPDLALLDLQMPELDGLGVVRLVRKDRLPLVAFVTAYDDYAVRAFEANAIDYLLKPVERVRLRETLNRAQERLERDELREIEAARLRATAGAYEEATRSAPLERIPVRHRDSIVLLPVEEIVSVIADRELLHITTDAGERLTITYRLKDLEARLDANAFVRLGRGTLVSARKIARIHTLPGGTYTVVMRDEQKLVVSRLQSRVLRDRLLKL